MKEDAALHSYGWVDKNAGTVHIPIEDAMRLMLERGALTTRPVDASKPQEPVDDVSVGFELRPRMLEKRRQ